MTKAGAYCPLLCFWKALKTSGRETGAASRRMDAACAPHGNFVKGDGAWPVAAAPRFIGAPFQGMKRRCHAIRARKAFLKIVASARAALWQQQAARFRGDAARRLFTGAQVTHGVAHR